MDCKDIQLPTANTMEEFCTAYLNDRYVSRTWEYKDQAINLCSKYVQLVRDFPKIADRIIDSARGNTSRRFYNDAVKYIVTGERTIRPEHWLSMIKGIFPECSVPMDNRANNGNVQAVFLFGEAHGRLAVSPKVQNSSLDQSLLSYAHCDVLQQWITRPNGLSDLILTCTTMAIVMESVVFCE